MLTRVSELALARSSKALALELVRLTTAGELAPVRLTMAWVPVRAR